MSGPKRSPHARISFSKARSSTLQLSSIKLKVPPNEDHKIQIKGSWLEGGFQKPWFIGSLRLRTAPYTICQIHYTILTLQYPYVYVVCRLDGRRCRLARRHAEAMPLGRTHPFRSRCSWFRVEFMQVSRACYFGCFNEASKSAKVLLNGMQAVIALTLIFLK